MKPLFLFFIVTLVFTSCVSNDIIDDRVAEKLSFNNTISELAITKSHQFTTKYTNNVGEVRTPKIEWTSSDANVLRVTNSGLITALNLGNASITASTNADGVTVSNTQNITVIALKAVLQLNNPIENLTVNRTHQYRSQFTNTLGQTQNLPIRWSSSNSAIATVNTDGLVSAKSEGAVTITASITSNGETISTTDNFRVIPVGESLSINNPIAELTAGQTHQYTTTYSNANGQNQNVAVRWQSSDAAIATIDNTGKVMAVKAGQTTLTVSYTNASGQTLTDTTSLTVKAPQIRQKSGTIKTTSSYELKGSFVIKEIPGTNDLELIVAADYKASTALPGLYLYLTNNPNTIANAKEIKKVAVFNGAHRYLIENTGINDYSHLLYWCKPFSVKVGEGEIQ